MKKETQQDELSAEVLPESECPEEAKDPVCGECEKAKAVAAEMTLAAQRIQADFDNYRKRNAESISKSRRDGESEVLQELLPAMDVFDAALKMIGDEAVAQGVRMIRSKLLSTLTRFEVKAIVSLNQPFDPEFHDAIEQSPKEGVESGTVIEVLQEGYKRGDKILRHAVVKVSM